MSFSAWLWLSLNWPKSIQMLSSFTRLRVLKLASSSLCSQTRLWTSNPPLSASQVLVPGRPVLRCGARTRPRASCILDKHMANWAVSPGPKCRVHETQKQLCYFHKSRAIFNTLSWWLNSPIDTCFQIVWLAWGTVDSDSAGKKVNGVLCTYLRVS